MTQNHRKDHLMNASNISNRVGKISAWVATSIVFLYMVGDAQNGNSLVWKAPSSATAKVIAGLGGKLPPQPIDHALVTFSNGFFVVLTLSVAATVFWFATYVTTVILAFGSLWLLSLPDSKAPDGDGRDLQEMERGPFKGRDDLSKTPERAVPVREL